MADDSTTDAGSDRTPPSGSAVLSMFPAMDWVDLVATMVMAVAALLTAWSAFQSDQWGDTMSFSLADAAAARTESSRNYTRAGQVTEVDVATFIAWLEAAQRDVAAGEVDPTMPYVPDPTTGSGWLYERFRPGFDVAMDAWLTTAPFTDPGAPSTPFAMPEYHVEEYDEAERLATLAGEKAAEAQAADRNDDKYVISTIIFAGVLLFAGLSTKMRSRAGQYGMLGFAILMLLGGALFLAAVPIQV